MTYQIGQRLPYAAPAPLWRDAAPQWYPLTTAPQAELAASAWLLRNGIEDAWYPTREHRTHLKRGRGKVVVRRLPEWPRYLFALMPPPVSWDGLFERSQKKITGVITVNGEAATIPERAMLDMKDVPNCLQAVRQAQLEAQRINPGDRAVILGGEMGDWTVTIDDVDAGFAWFMIPLLGGVRMEIEIGRLRKVL